MICREENPFVNSLLIAGIADAWNNKTTDASEADIFNRIRTNSILFDAVDASLYGSNGVTGANINTYHDLAFEANGISTGVYGGNIIPSEPSGIPHWLIPPQWWPNPVPPTAPR
jgi:hypothetical protein